MRTEKETPFPKTICLQLEGLYKLANKRKKGIKINVTFVNYLKYTVNALHI